MNPYKITFTVLGELRVVLLSASSAYDADFKFRDAVYDGSIKNLYRPVLHREIPTTRDYKFRSSKELSYDQEYLTLLNDQNDILTKVIESKQKWIDRNTEICNELSRRIKEEELRKKNKMHFTTNNQSREVLYWNDLTNVQQEELKDNYDSINESIFTIYKGHVYDIGDAMVMTEEDGYWHAYISETHFSGIVIHVSNDGDEVVMGTYFSTDH